MVFAALLDFFRNLPYGESLLPLAPVSRIVAATGTVNAQEACKAACAQRLLKGSQRVLPELLIGHLCDDALFIVVHDVNPLLQFTGFSTAILGVCRA
jgi:hypothetical protein